MIWKIILREELKNSDWTLSGYPEHVAIKTGLIIHVFVSDTETLYQNLKIQPKCNPIVEAVIFIWIYFNLFEKLRVKQVTHVSKI